MQQGSFRGFDVAMRGGGVVTITFNQPERLNGMTQGMKRDLVEILHEAQMDDAVRVLVFTGSGRAFSAGDDISGKPRDESGARAIMPEIAPGHRDPIGTYEGLRVMSQALNLAVRNLDKITIAAINGVAIQTGLSLALARFFQVSPAYFFDEELTEFPETEVRLLAASRRETLRRLSLTLLGLSDESLNSVLNLALSSTWPAACASWKGCPSSRPQLCSSARRRLWAGLRGRLNPIPLFRRGLVVHCSH